MAQVIQLESGFNPAKAAPRLWHDGRRILSEFNGTVVLEPSPKAGKDPCRGCWAKGLCDDGECGRKLFPIDVDD